MSTHTRPLGPPAAPGRRWQQGRLDELGTPLAEVTFCVVDLETTGGSVAAGDTITEIGAVKVRGGTVLGEFQTLVNTGRPVPPFIAGLTGIDDALLAPAPGIGAVLPAFLEFAHGCALVAHNAPFDIGFLRAAAHALGYRWPPFEVLDTVQLARRLLGEDEVADCRLASLAWLFRSTEPPRHRALADARATTDVLHGLLERVGSLGVHTWDELVTYSAQVTPAQWRKRHLAEKLPGGPGAFLFTGAGDEVLHVGWAHDVRTRVRAYFTAAGTRRALVEMVDRAADATALACATGLHARVTALRLIAEHQPPYNHPVGPAPDEPEGTRPTPGAATPGAGAAPGAGAPAAESDHASLAGCRQLVAVRADPGGGCEVHVVRYGRLAAAHRVPPGTATGPVVARVVATAEGVAPEPAAAAARAELACVARWLGRPSVRLVEIDGQWCCPLPAPSRPLPSNRSLAGGPPQSTPPGSAASPGPALKEAP